MWTGKQHRQWAALIVALLLTGCTTPGAGNESGVDSPAAAWWYAIGFEPASTYVNGIPASRFNPDWARATALDVSQLDGRISEGDLAAYGSSGFSFELRSDLDKDGAGEVFFVGVFETASGSEGRFLAITRDGQLLQHFEYPGSAGFSALIPGTNEIRWYVCMECGEFESLRWSGRSYVLE